MNREIEDIVTHEVIPVVRAVLRETSELCGAVQVLAAKVDQLSNELAQTDLYEIPRLLAKGLKLLDAIHSDNGGAR
jgi:hypothetical protein